MRVLRPVRIAAGLLALSATLLAGPVGAAPVGGAAPAPPPSSPASTSSANGAYCYYGACYNYVYGYQYAAASGASVVMSQDRPDINTADPDSHSLQELAVESADGEQIVEFGWTVDQGLNGDTIPHLFTYHWINGQETCYNACGFVSTNRLLHPGLAIPPGTLGVFGIDFHSGDWWISYDGIPIGYYPGSLWGGTFTQFGLVQTFGEVASTSVPTCNDMGDGRFGTNLFSAFIAGFRLLGSTSAPQLTLADTTPSEYDYGFTTPTSFHLGGPGDGPCPAGS